MLKNESMAWIYVHVSKIYKHALAQQKGAHFPILGPSYQRSNRDNLGIISHISPIKTLEPSHQDGSNEGSQHVFYEK